MDCTVVENDTHPDLALWKPIFSPVLDDMSGAALQAFIDHCLVYCSFLTPARIAHLFERFSSAPSSLDPDQTALISACLAVGYCRLQYFPMGTSAVRVSDSDRKDVAWYRQSMQILDDWGSASFNSLRE